MDGDEKTIDWEGRGSVFFRGCDMSRRFDELFVSAFGTVGD